MKAARVFITLLLLVGTIGALVTGADIYSRFLYLGGLLLFGGLIWTFAATRGLRLTRNSRITRANVGDSFEEHFEVVNGSRIVAPWIEVFNRSRIPNASGSRLLTLVRGRQTRTYLARTWLTRRGAFALGPTRISTGDPFGLFRWSREFPSSQTLIVLPMLFEVKSFPLPPGLLPGGQVIRRKSPDITPHAAGVREYAPGDAMKRIHWATSIRRGQLMVKEFEQDPQAEVWLFLDSQKKVHYEKEGQTERHSPESSLFGKRPEFHLPPSTLEYAVSIAASLAHYFIAQRRAVGYASAGQTFTVHHAERSERQEGRILETLAFVEADGRLSLAALVSAQASQLPQGSTAILITPSVNPELLQAVDDLQRRYLRPIVILLDSQTFGGESGSEKLARSLRERRVPVCFIACNDDLRQALSTLTTNFTPQEMRTWQNPVLSL
jgi:uncharacterized protein (DUF58 family)